MNISTIEFQDGPCLKLFTLPLTNFSYALTMQFRNDGIIWSKQYGKESVKTHLGQSKSIYFVVSLKVENYKI